MLHLKPFLLIIAPRGIEIKEFLEMVLGVELIIAPRGIEISSMKPQNLPNFLIIAPRGIEILSNNCRVCFFTLIIAPRGIEMSIFSTWQTSTKSYNRTKRNWNIWVNYIFCSGGAYNRTKRNWNSRQHKLSDSRRWLIIAPRGIEISKSE